MALHASSLSTMLRYTAVILTLELQFWFGKTERRLRVMVVTCPQDFPNNFEIGVQSIYVFCDLQMDLYLHALHKVTVLKSTSSFHVLVLEILDS